jgi:ribonuclease Y
MDLISSVSLIGSLAIASLLIIINVYDIRHKIIPDNIVYPFIAISFLSIFWKYFFTPGFNIAPAVISGILLSAPFFFLWFFSKAKEDINKIIKQKGEEAVYECGLFNLDPRVVAILGRLHFRTSYGQNVLAHSVEMAHIGGIIATELGADVAVAKAGCLVHDIGKALTHEVQGTHVEIGMRILQKFGTDPRIIDAMKSHHEEFPYETIESHIVQTADAISGGRPGARSDTAENYLKRLTELETLIDSFDGVEKSYAIAAGREVRVFVNPEKVTDMQAADLSRDIAKAIENELKYPGEIKVIVIRENRIVSYAR